MEQTPGFLLTRHWRDTAAGIELSYWAWTPSGALRLLFPTEQAVCFVPRNSLLPGHNNYVRRPLALADLQGNPVDGLYFERHAELRELRQQAAAAGVELLESDIKPVDRFLMERFVTASFTARGKSIDQGGFQQMIAPQIRSASIQPRLNYISLDIETDGVAGEVLSIALVGCNQEQILMQGSAEELTRGLPVCWYANEQALLSAFFRRISRLDPDLIIGWNLINFDLDYLQRRCHRHRIPFALGRGNELAAILQPRGTGQPKIAAIPGRVALDGIDNLRSAFWSFDSFSLDRVASKLLGRQKLINPAVGKIQEIRRLFREDKPGLAAYNLEDCRLVEMIFEKTGLIDFCVQRAAMTGLALGRQGGSVAAFDHLYLPRLHRRGVVARDVGARSYTDSSPGGYVMDSRPGLYDNVLVLDFKSLYPSIIRTFRIDPLGMVRPGNNPIPGFLGARFSRTDSILPDIITTLWAQREHAKQHRNNPLAQATKILMNSFYGVLGSSGCRFFHPGLASSITRRGHEIITRSRDWLEQAGYPVIYGDTDSLFILLGEGYLESQALNTGRRLAGELNDWWRTTLQQEYQVDSSLELEFEIHFIKFLMPTIRGSDAGSKKRYAGSVRSPDGGFEVKFKGLESVRSDWTPMARSFQQELYRRIFFGEPYRDYVKDVAKRLLSGQLDAQLIYRKRLRQPLDQYRRNQPPHVQAARKSAHPGRRVSYLITVNGPEPTDNLNSPIDYQHYIKKQLAPAADGILHFLNESFDQIAGDQLRLF
ncbi:MAG: DNA polymerase II [Gammaproteobacteria bacterium]|nr:DNA polymerase II [Gammaproteobacteria bacterium]